MSISRVSIVKQRVRDLWSTFSLFLFPFFLLSPCFSKLLNKFLSVFLVFHLCGIIGLVGKVDFTVRHLSSTTTNFPTNWEFSGGQQCVGGSGVHQVTFPFLNL